MTLSIIIRSPDGIVLATESRSLTEVTLPNGSKCPISFDETKKLLTFDEPHNFVAAVTTGLGGIGNRSVYNFVPDFEATIASEGRMPVDEFSEKMSNFFMKEWERRPPEMKDWKGPSISFLAAGFNEGDAYPHTYKIDIPSEPKPVELPQIDITWGGEGELVNRLIKGYDPNLPKRLSDAWSLTEEQVKAMPEIAQPLSLQFPLPVMGLQGYIDLAVLLLRTTIETQRLALYVRGCGGPIDMATITRGDGLCFVRLNDEDEIC
jgi:hypothetical protein